MPINFKLDDDAGCAHDVVRTWEVGGHEVAVIMHGRLDDPDGRRAATLVCVCDYDAIPLAGGQGYRLRNDPRKCMAKEVARTALKNEAAVALRLELAQNGIEAAVLEAHRKVSGGECLGQAHAGILYVQEAAELLGKRPEEVFAAVKRLFAQERLDLNGMILVPYVPHFRFPEEIRMMIRMMVETPLGWPNGDAGGCAIETLEQAVNEGTGYKKGKDLFWEHNCPNVAPNHLLEFGILFIATVIGRAEKEEAVRNDLRFIDLEQVARQLEASAARYRALGQAHGFPHAYPLPETKDDAGNDDKK